MPGDAQGVSVPLSLFSGLVTELSDADIPAGLSPANQDVMFLPGSVSSRWGLHKIYATPISGNVTVVYHKTYVQPDGRPITLVLDSAGNLWKEDIVAAPGVLILATAIPAGSYAQSCSAFGREYIAVSDLIHGSDVPMQFDGTNFDRVTQDGPGQGPSVVNITPPVATIQGPGAPATVPIAASPNGIVWGGLTNTNPAPPPFIYYFTYFTVTTTAPHGLSVGQKVFISGSTSNPGLNVPWPVATIVSPTKFRVNFYAYQGSAVNGGNGAITTAVSSVSMIRNSNLVTAVTNGVHNFQAGWQVQITGITNNPIGGGIISISRDANGIVTVNTLNPHGLPSEAIVNIAGVINPDTSYNGKFPVASVPSPTSFTYQQSGTQTASSAGTGNVQDVWNGTFFIQSITSPASFTYRNIGPDDTTTAIGTATILGQIAPGTHQCVLMFLTRQGYLTAPSPPVPFVANGGGQAGVSNLAIGPANVIARVLGFTGAGGGNYFTQLTTPMVNGQVVGTALLIPDNTSTAAIIDFSDNVLFGGLGIDIPGRNQFAQVVLGPCTGFFSYASRLFAWGELNKLQNFLNMGFDGGLLPPPAFVKTAGSGANSGSGTPWTNPGNIASSSSYADVALPAFGSSQQLLAETFGFAISSSAFPAPIGNITVSFEAYETGVGAGAVEIEVQLLKAGIPFGSPVRTIVDPAATSGSPQLLQVQFPTTGLVPSDLNSSSWGFQIQATELEVSATPTVFVRHGVISAVILTGLPLGWQTQPGGAGTGTLIPTALAGFAYEMVSAGTGMDAQLFQSAYQDQNGIAILKGATAYGVRLKASAQAGLTGNLRVKLELLTAGIALTASFAVSAIGTAAKFYQATFDVPTSATIPSDARLLFYLDAVPNGGVVTVDELEIFPIEKPYRDNLMRGSYVNGPEQFDGVTGDIGPAGDPSPLRSLFEMRGTMYLNTAYGRHETTDNQTGEPSTWSVREISESVGALSLKSSDPGKFGSGDSGEQWQFTASRSGLYIFWGGEDIKVSQEIQSLWDSINLGAQHTIWVKNDSTARRCYVGVPQGSATAPDVILVLDYRELNDPSSIGGMAPFRQSTMGRMIASEICRKWTVWNVAANSGEIIRRPANAEQFTVGAGNGQTPGTANGFGNVYYFDPAKLTDDDYGQIVPFYTTYFFVSHDDEQAMGLDCHRKLATYLTQFISGTGQTMVTPLGDTLANAFPDLETYPLDPNQNFDLEWDINVDGERIALRIGSIPNDGETDNAFNLGKLVLTLKKHPWSGLRGTL